MFRLPRSPFRVSTVSNCHTGTNSLDCPVKYAPPLPPADLRDPSGPDRCADRPGRRGLGARGANGGAVRRGARGARRSGGVGTPDGGSNGHDPPLGTRAGGVPGAPGAALQLGDAGAPRGDVLALLCRRVRGGRLRARRVCRDRGGARGRPPVAPALPSDRRARGLDAADPATHAPAGGPADSRRSGIRSAAPGPAGALDAARERELEAERLRAFREVARRVAHEIKNPLTAMRIAVDQLRRSLKDSLTVAGGPVERRTDVAVEVIGAETERLDQLAKEFSEFGRLPQGPRSEVDLVDL